MPSFTNHGVAAAVSESRGVLTARAAGGSDLVVVLPMDRYRGELRASLLVVDPATGKSEQYWYPRKEAGTDAPFAVLLASTERVYTTFGPTFLEFDLAQRRWTFDQKAGTGGAAMSLAEAPDGRVYIGMYPSCELFEFDPAKRSLTRRGKLDPREEYPSSMVATKDGWVYAGIGTARCNLVAFRPSTGEIRSLVPDAERVTGSGVVGLGADGVAYGRAAPSRQWVRLEAGRAEPVSGVPALLKDVGGMHWSDVRTALGNGARVDGFDLAERRFRVVTSDGASRDVRFDYESSGAAVASFGMGPDGSVYGNTSHPMRFFRVDPGDGKVITFGGIRRVGGGNFPAIASAGGHVFGMAYSGGDVYDFDPNRPWAPEATGDGANPRLVANFRPHIGRPRGALAHSDGHTVLFGGFPGYGYTGGGLFLYDTALGGKPIGLTAEQLLPGQSPITMDELPGGDVVAGTSVSTPGGGHAKASSAEIFVLDWKTKTVRSHLGVEGSREVVSVCTAGDGRVYAVTRESALLVYDPAANRIVHRADLKSLGVPANAGHRTLLRTGDGRVLLVLSKAIGEIDPRTLEVRTLAEPPEPISAVGAVAGGRLYFGSDASVWSYRLRPADRAQGKQP